MNIKWPWKSILALSIIYIALYFQLGWVWGLLFIFWTVRSLYSGETFLVEPITKTETPVMYWLIIVTWFLLSGLLIVNDVIKYLGVIK